MHCANAIPSTPNSCAPTTRRPRSTPTTTPASGRRSFEDYAKANRYNVLVESLMTSPDGVGGWLKDYRDAGYRTEAHVVAVNERSSLQGIAERYELQKLKSEDNVGRTVPRDVHNLAYDRVRDTFDRIETDKLLCGRTLNLVMEDTLTSFQRREP